MKGTSAKLIVGSIVLSGIGFVSMSTKSNTNISPESEENLTEYWRSKENETLPEKIAAEEETLEQKANAHFFKEVRPQLLPFVTYSKKKSFSRCITGFSQRINEDLSIGETAYGEIFNNVGCERKHFCFYHFDLKTGSTFLKEKENESFVSMKTFVDQKKNTSHAANKS